VMIGGDEEPAPATTVLAGDDDDNARGRLERRAEAEPHTSGGDEAAAADAAGTVELRARGGGRVVMALPIREGEAVQRGQVLVAFESSHHDEIATLSD